MSETEQFEKLVERTRRRRRRDGIALGLLVTGLLYVPALGVLKAVGSPDASRFRMAMLVAPALAGGLFIVVWMVTHSAGRVTQAMLNPSSAGTRPLPLSQAEALARQGRMEESIAAFDEIHQRFGERAQALRAEAEIHLKRGGQAARARDLLMRLRKAADATPQDELYATQRLIDLYFGPLGDEQRALVEMRRLVHRFPGTRDAEGAQVELDRRRARNAVV